MKLKEQIGLYRPLFWLLFFIATASIIDIIVTRLHSYSYSPDRQAIGSKGWQGRQTYYAPAFLRLVPWQIPGPMDSGWAGKSPKSIGIEIPYHRKSLVTFSFMDSHNTNPPVIQASIHGKPIGDLAISPGQGMPASEWADSGLHSELRITVPDKLTPGVLWLTPTQGSWVALEGVKVRNASPMWEYALAIFSTMIIIMVIRKEVNIPQLDFKTWKRTSEVSWRTVILLGVVTLLVVGILINRATFFEDIIAKSNDDLSVLDKKMASVITCAKPGAKILYSPDFSGGQYYFMTQYAIAPLILDVKSKEEMGVGDSTKTSSRLIHLPTGYVEAECEARVK